MVEAVSVGIGVVALFAGFGAYLAGYVRSRSAGYIVDMREVSNYYRHKNTNEALSQDVEDNG
jgi:hypothetical protein